MTEYEILIYNLLAFSVVRKKYLEFEFQQVIRIDLPLKYFLKNREDQYWLLEKPGSRAVKTIIP